MRTPPTIVLLAALACDPGPAAAPAPTKEEAKGDDAALQKRKAEREAKAKAEADAKAEHEAAIDALIVLPEKVPAKLDKACAEMTAAYDKYMRKVLTGDMLTKWETGGNDMQIKVFDRECKKKNAQVAACQTHALTKLAPEMKDELAVVMGKCAEKFGSAG